MKEQTDNKNKSIIIDAFSKLDLPLSDRQAEQFLRFYELLIEKNKVMNLTAITEFEEVLTKHFLDSLLVVRTGEMPAAGRVLDLGTGAGFPGIPLKIAFPDMDLTLADSLNKRIRFLDEVTEELGLKGVRTVHARAEDLGRDPAHREQYDRVVSRAVANLSSLSEYCLPLVKKGGTFISYKSINIDTEAKEADRAIRLLGGNTERIEKYTLPRTNLERAFVIVRKEQATPGKYPRKAGVPSKSPL